MKHLEEVARMIEAEGVALVGRDLFIGTLPANVTRGVMLRDPLTGVAIDDGMKDFYSTEFQVVVRDTDVRRGYDTAEAISRIVKVDNLEAAEVFISWMHPCTKPVSYPRGDANDIETSFRVRIGWAEPSPT